MIKLLICDDSDEARRLVRTVLADHPEIEIVGEAADGETAVALAAELEPDVVLMDIGMAGLDGVEATRKIRAHRPETRVVAFTGLDDEETVQGMLEAGAASFVVKGAPLWELERALQGEPAPPAPGAHARPHARRASAIGFLPARRASSPAPPSPPSTSRPSRSSFRPEWPARPLTRSPTRGRARRRASFGVPTARRDPLLPAAAS